VSACAERDAARAIAGADVVVPGMTPVGPELMDAGPGVVIHQFGGGLDMVDLDAARARGIPVARLPTGVTGNAAAVADIAVLHLLALARNLARARVTVDEGGLGEPAGRSIAGMRVAVVGLGQVGRAVARRLHGFEAVVTGIGRRPMGDQERSELGLADYRDTAELRSVLTQADALILCCALTEETRGMIGADELGVMPPGSFLVNVARGPVVRYDALLAALRSGALAGAGLDVFWDEPIDPDDPILREAVSVTPHLGASTREAHRSMAEEFAANVERLRNGCALSHRVC
jgi:phosphoglycerate dehydrogenase-like enzyme